MSMLVPGRARPATESSTGPGRLQSPEQGQVGYRVQNRAMPDQEEPRTARPGQEDPKTVRPGQAVPEPIVRPGPLQVHHSGTYPPRYPLCTPYHPWVPTLHPAATARHHAVHGTAWHAHSGGHFWRCPCGLTST